MANPECAASPRRKTDASINKIDLGITPKEIEVVPVSHNLP